MTESTRHRRAFERYFRLGPDRSLTLLHEALAAEGGRVPALRTLEEWSRTYHWQHRIANVERRARDAEDEARIAAIRAMQERHMQEALLLQQRGSQWLAEFGADDASPEAAIRAIAEGVRIERLARGEPTERTETTDPPDSRLERFSDDELERLIDAAGIPLGGAASQES